MKILLFSNDTMPFGHLPTSGGGLRCWQIYQGLKSRGYEVVASMPSFTYLTKKYFDQIPEEVRENLWEWHTQDDIFRRIKPDLVIYSSNWDHFNLIKKPDVPLVIDLHGSRLIETSLWGETPDIQKKLSVFSKADCLLTAGQKQKMYFYGWLLQSGRIPEGEDFIKYIPISLSPDRFSRKDNTEGSYPYFVSGGGWFPWQDQSSAIFEICNQIKQRSSGLFNIFGTPHENSSPSQDELKIRNIFNHVKAISESSDNINVIGYVGRDDLLNEYSKANVAVELMNYNLERELAFTTRTIEYLWCGLPVIYNNYSEISSHIKEYDAGWAIDPSDKESLTNVIEDIFSNKALVEMKSRNAQNLVCDRFSWDKTIEPLDQFIKNPVLVKESKPVRGFTASASSFLEPKSKEGILRIDRPVSLEQGFIFPAESIWAINFSITLDSKFKDSENNIASEHSQASCECTVKNSFGVTIGKINLELREPQTSALIKISRIFRPFGGSRGTLFLKFKGLDSNAVALLKVNSEPVFPLSQIKIDSNGEFICRDSMSRACLYDSFCISFIAGSPRLFDYKAKALKALWLIKEGDYKRVVRAVLRRSPRLNPILKHFL